VVVSPGLAVIAQGPDPGGDVIVAGRHEPGVPVRAQVLGGIKGERGGDAEPADRAAPQRRPDGLGRVLQEDQPVGVGERPERTHGGREAEEVDGQDRPRPRRQGSGDTVGVQGQRGGVDVGEDRSRAHLEDGRGGGHEREGRGDDLVSGAEVERAEEEPERVRSGGHADGVLDAERGSTLGFQRLSLGPQDEPSTPQHAPHRCFDLRLDVGVLTGQIELGDLHRKAARVCPKP